MFEDDPPPASIDPPPDSIDPGSIPGRLTLIEERLKAMSIGPGSLSVRTARRRHRSSTRRRNSVVKLGLAFAMLFVLALFVLFADLAPSPTVVPSADPSNAAEPASRF